MSEEEEAGVAERRGERLRRRLRASESLLLPEEAEGVVTFRTCFLVRLTVFLTGEGDRLRGDGDRFGEGVRERERALRLGEGLREAEGERREREREREREGERERARLRDRDRDAEAIGDWERLWEAWVS